MRLKSGGLANGGFANIRKWIEAHERRQEQQESQFNLDPIKESIERMKPELITCSAAAHKAKDADAGDDPEFDRVVELGSLVECLGGMCGPHLMLLHEIARALDEVHEAEGEQERRHHRHH